MRFRLRIRCGVSLILLTIQHNFKCLEWFFYSYLWLEYMFFKGNMIFELLAFLLNEQMYTHRHRQTQTVCICDCWSTSSGWILDPCWQTQPVGCCAILSLHFGSSVAVVIFWKKKIGLINFWAVWPSCCNHLPIQNCLLLELCYPVKYYQSSLLI